MTKKEAHRIELRVRGYELDSYGHVNNAVYLNWYEQARWEFLKDTGILDKINQKSLFLVIAETTIRYIRECRLFDDLEVETEYKTEGPYVVFRQRIINRDNQLPVSRATVKTVFVDEQRIPQDIPGFMKNNYPGI